MKPRTENELDALNHVLSKPEENNCQNCGWGFLPPDQRDDKSCRFCTKWENEMRSGYWCRAWDHHTTVINGIYPYWCNQDKSRKMSVSGDYRLVGKFNGYGDGINFADQSVAAIAIQRREAKRKKARVSRMFYCQECGVGTPHTIDGCVACQENELCH